MSLGCTMLCHALTCSNKTSPRTTTNALRQRHNMQCVKAECSTERQHSQQGSTKQSSLYWLDHVKTTILQSKSTSQSNNPFCIKWAYSSEIPLGLFKHITIVILTGIITIIVVVSVTIIIIAIIMIIIINVVLVVVVIKKKKRRRGWLLWSINSVACFLCPVPTHRNFYQRWKKRPPSNMSLLSHKPQIFLELKAE